MSRRRFVATTVTMGCLALAHALATWPIAATVAFFGGGALVAFVAEALVIRLDWLAHHIGPRVLGVPLYVIFGWTGTVYLAFRLSLLVVADWRAVLAAGLLAATMDATLDPRGVRAGHWTYTDDLPGPRVRGVPWWNAAGWLVVGWLTAGLATLQL